MNTPPDLPAVFAEVVTQERFANLVGITQPSVSDLMSRGVITVGETAGAWLLSYCAHLREIGEGRDPDGQLASERTRLASEQADRLAMANARYRSENVPNAFLAFVLGSITRQVIRELDAIVPSFTQRFPQVTGEPLRYLEEQISLARSAASSATLNAEALEVDAEDQDDDSPG